jgi:hypothetical protein
MTEVARNATQEYWKPVQTQRTEIRGMEAETICANCGSEYAVGARFCHVCGNEREPEMKISRQARIAQMVNFDQLCEKVGLSAAALVLAVIGAVCVLGAILVGLIYTANTVLDWQAVQVWRIQWMLGALVAFVAAILFNRKKTA